MVQGTLWIMEQMIRQNLITIEQAREAYQRMKECKRRLPWALAEEKLKVLEKEIAGCKINLPIITTTK